MRRSDRSRRRLRRSRSAGCGILLVRRLDVEPWRRGGGRTDIPRYRHSAVGCDGQSRGRRWRCGSAAELCEREPRTNEYPWGSTDPGTQNQYAIYGCYFGPPDAQANCSVTTPPGIAPVGTPTLGIGIWGQLDLAGNVWEQTLDGFSAAYVDPCVDCAYLGGTAKIVRGGCFISTEEEIVPPNRFALLPNIRNNYVGFRCARTP